jgi:hypothetical protein
MKNSKQTEATASPETTPKSSGRKAVKSQKVKTAIALQVFSKKSIDESTASKMRPGAEVILEFLEATAPNGDQIVRVRKDGSTRTFYTTETLAQEVLA